MEWLSCQLNTQHAQELGERAALCRCHCRGLASYQTPRFASQRESCHELHPENNQLTSPRRSSRQYAVVTLEWAGRNKVSKKATYRPELRSLLRDRASDGRALHLTLGVDNLHAQSTSVPTPFRSGCSSSQIRTTPALSSKYR